jgi:hypothetical protein
MSDARTTKFQECVSDYGSNSYYFGKRIKFPLRSGLTGANKKGAMPLLIVSGNECSWSVERPLPPEADNSHVVSILPMLGRPISQHQFLCDGQKLLYA